MRTRNSMLLGLVLLAGCSGKDDQQKFPDLHPVKGVVKRGGQPVGGGSIRFTPEPDKPEFAINSEVGTDGTYNLTTVRTTDKQGERKSGAPAGSYKVTYTPPLGDQTQGGQPGAVTLPNAVTVNAGQNDIPLEVGKK